MKQRKKKMILLISGIPVMLLALMIYWKPWDKAEENNASNNESETQENSGQESSSQEESGIVILENEGNIEIIIPEDMDSDGF